MLTKLVCSIAKKRLTDQWNRTETPEMCPNKYSHFICNKCV